MTPPQVVQGNAASTSIWKSALPPTVLHHCTSSSRFGYDHTARSTRQIPRSTRAVSMFETTFDGMFRRPYRRAAASSRGRAREAQHRARLRSCCKMTCNMGSSSACAASVNATRRACGSPHEGAPSRSSCHATSGCVWPCSVPPVKNRRRRMARVTLAQRNHLAHETQHVKLSHRRSASPSTTVRCPAISVVVAALGTQDFIAGEKHGYTGSAAGSQ